MQKKKERRNKKIIVRGLVTPVSWDDDGKATHVSIATFDEDEYFLDDKKAGLRLLNHLGKEATIMGVLDEIDEKKYLKSCSILQPPANTTKARP